MAELRIEPGPVQTAVEGIVTVIMDTVSAVAPRQAAHIMPFIGSLWIFLVVANLSGLLPGVHAPTRDLSATTALAIMPSTTRLVLVPMRVVMPPRIDMKESGMRSCDGETLNFAPHRVSIGINMATTGVLLRNADSSAVAARKPLNRT